MALNIKKEMIVYGTSVILDCIVTIINVRGNKNEIIADCNFTHNGNIVDTKSYLFLPSLDGDNFIKQGYDYLKTLDEFKDAEDC